MGTPLFNVNLAGANAHLMEQLRQWFCAYETLLSIDEVDVGTAPKDLVYQEDKLQLYHYQQGDSPSARIPTLLVYALVNRPYMLDLQPDRSLVRNLLAHGIDLYLIDWGYPTRADAYLTLEDYVCGYIDNCVDAIREQTGSPAVNIIGICQGGTLSVMYAALFPEKVNTLTTIVTPVDFSTDDALLFRWAKDFNVDAVVDAYGVVPADFLNTGFMMLRPFGRIEKYLNFLTIADDREKVLNFLRMEKWIFDSPDQAGECYRQFVKDLYQQNKLIQDKLRVGEQRVVLKNITMPVLNIYGTKDHIVPAAAVTPLTDHVGSTDTSLYAFESGHIGVFVSSKAQKELAPAIAAWLQERS